MLAGAIDELYPSAKTLINEHVASRILAKDATLYSFSKDAQDCAAEFMGWTDLASHPPISIDDIQAFAQDAIASGLKTVVLIGQGGSTQAPMTITKYNKEASSQVSFKTLDSDSPVRVRGILAEVDPATTLFLISSKSGGTIEPRLALRAVRSELADKIPDDELVKHLVAITDPGSDLERQAREEGWSAVFSGEPTVGGRFSALSVFGLLPAALVGIDLHTFIGHATAAEHRCSEDSANNPAIELAAFLYDNYLRGRNKFSFLTPKRGRVLGLWIEQLVAESLGKEGQGMLPNIELDALLLNKDAGDRSVIVYQTKTDLWDERKNFEMGLAYLSPAIPRLTFKVENVEELAEHFVMWEYAIAMCGYLMKVCPFDQPDVASAKQAVLNILRDGQPKPDFVEHCIGDVCTSEVEVTVAPALTCEASLRDALRALIGSIRPGDYFALNAFLPFTGEGRREALEAIRRSIGATRGVVSCLEVGPRYLHSTGQLHKGGPNNGVFLIVSADEPKDIALTRAGEACEASEAGGIDANGAGVVDAADIASRTDASEAGVNRTDACEAASLGALAKAQAAGDLGTLAARGRRCIHVHLPDHAAVTLRALSELILEVLEEFELQDR